MAMRLVGYLSTKVLMASRILLTYDPKTKVQNAKTVLAKAPQQINVIFCAFSDVSIPMTRVFTELRVALMSETSRLMYSTSDSSLATLASIMSSPPPPLPVLTRLWGCLLPESIRNRPGGSKEYNLALI